MFVISNAKIETETETETEIRMRNICICTAIYVTKSTALSCYANRQDIYIKIGIQLTGNGEKLFFFFTFFGMWIVEIVETQ